jgi:hypothetical protein
MNSWGEVVLASGSNSNFDTERAKMIDATTIVVSVPRVLPGPAHHAPGELPPMRLARGTARFWWIKRYIGLFRFSSSSSLF